MIVFRSYLKIFMNNIYLIFINMTKKSVGKPFVITIDLSAFFFLIANMNF